jgi:hypothetical protein
MDFDDFSDLVSVFLDIAGSENRSFSEKIVAYSYATEFETDAGMRECYLECIREMVKPLHVI